MVTLAEPTRRRLPLNTARPRQAHSARWRSVSDSDEMLVLRGTQERRESARRFRDSPNASTSSQIGAAIASVRASSDGL